MTTVTDEQLELYADRVKGKVVVITGDGLDIECVGDINSDIAWDRCFKWNWQRNCIAVCKVWVNPIAWDSTNET